MTGVNIAQAITAIKPAVLPSSIDKIAASQQAFERYLDGEVLTRAFAQRVATFTPARFLHGMRERCKADVQRIVLPESQDHRILQAAAEVHAKGWAHVVLLGDPAAVRQVRALHARACGTRAKPCCCAPSSWVATESWAADVINERHSHLTHFLAAVAHKVTSVGSLPHGRVGQRAGGQQ